MTLVSIDLADYRISTAHLNHLAAEFYGKQLGVSTDGTTVEFGFDGDKAQANAKGFRDILDSTFRLPDEDVGDKAA